jgi:predicted nucleic acid-binding protein
MSERIVVNTSPLIALGKMGAFNVVERLPFDFISPVQVQDEILAGSAKGYSVEVPSWLQVISLSNPLSKLTLSSLDEGEAAVIELALELGISHVCLDELKGRRAASAAGLSVVGSLGLIGKAKSLGLISSVRGLVKKAQDSGIYYEGKLVEAFLKGLGE